MGLLGYRLLWPFNDSNKMSYKFKTLNQWFNLQTEQID